MPCVLKDKILKTGTKIKAIKDKKAKDRKIFLFREKLSISSAWFFLKRKIKKIPFTKYCQFLILLNELWTQANGNGSNKIIEENII
jgi:hypothetical protein